MADLVQLRGGRTAGYEEAAVASTPALETSTRIVSAAGADLQTPPPGR
jgi:hypothetical protein